MPQKYSKTEQEHLRRLWQELSLLVQRARTTMSPSLANPELAHHIKADPNGVLTPALNSWMADSLIQEGRTREAVRQLNQIVKKFPDRKFSNAAWASSALDRIAACHEAKREYKRAADAHKLNLEKFSSGRSRALLQYRIARLAERAGRTNDAINGFNRAARLSDRPEETQVSIRELARRDAARLKSDHGWMFREFEDLAHELALRLERKQTGKLEKLASPTHFSLGVHCGEADFTGREKVLGLFFRDLLKSNVNVDTGKIWGSGDKRYLATANWSGEHFVGQVILLLSKTLYGWEWSGIALTQFPEGWVETLGPPSQGTNQPLALAIRAPWPAGLSFRAGGIVPFAAQLTGCLALGVPFAQAMCLVMASFASPCGFGPGGLYYGGVAGIGFTHTGQDFFAVDFARFLQGVPALNITVNTPVLAVQSGLVSGVRGDTVSGAATITNSVLIKHMTEEGFLIGALIAILSGTRLTELARPRFTSRYLHLAGPNQLQVSAGMFVPQGGRLGLMDDTGTSVDHHLHFGIYDRTGPGFAVEGPLTPAGPSVRPNPMDGQTLNNADDGRCITSSNVPVP